LAQSYQGQGDPDFSKQQSLDVLVERLLVLKPQRPVKDRLPLLQGTWKQVWGPYDYRNNDRGVDPKASPADIYQVIFPEGYYYNVMPLKEGSPSSETRITLLRGKYKLSKKNENYLKVRFTRNSGNKGLPEALDYWDLAEKAENGTLPEKITVVPRWVVWLFFGKGTLNEVYTDDTLRIAYGVGDEKSSLYIMTRVPD